MLDVMRVYPVALQYWVSLSASAAHVPSVFTLVRLIVTTAGMPPVVGNDGALSKIRLTNPNVLSAGFVLNRLIDV